MKLMTKNGKLVYVADCLVPAYEARGYTDTDGVAPASAGDAASDAETAVSADVSNEPETESGNDSADSPTQNKSKRTRKPKAE